MTNRTREEVESWRTASPQKLFDLTAELQTRTEQALDVVAPQLAHPYRDYALNREAVALLKLTQATAETLSGRKPAVATALASLNPEATDLPTEIRNLWRQAESMQQLLFDPLNKKETHLVKAYICCALEPGEQKDQTTLREFRAGWDLVCTESKSITRIYNPYSYYLTIDMLPPRTDLKVGNRNLKGWAKTKFNLEEAKTAVMDIIQVMESSREYLAKRV